MKQTILIIILAIACFTLPATDQTPYINGELIIQIVGDYRDNDKVDASLGVLVNGFSQYDLKLTRELSRRMRIWLVEFSDELISTEEMLLRIKKSSVVEEAQFNHLVELRETIPSDEHFPQQWALKNTGQNGGLVGADVSATLAWDITTGGETANGKEIVAAVIDNGFALNHEDLVFWINENEIPDNGIDDDDNGYIDDYQGWNAYDNNGNLPAAAHGTHVSGIIGAIGDNEIGVAGVNWGVNILPIAGSSSNEATVVAAYGYVLEMRSRYNETNGEQGAYIVVTNSSFGVNYGNYQNYPLWGAMYEAMGEQGILSVAATMNVNANVDEVGDMPTSHPSPFIVGVTSTDRHDNKSSSAAYGLNSIDLGAPGSVVYSTVLNNGYSTMSGTSMSAPHVAGAIALMYAAAPEAMLLAYEDDPAELALLMKELLLDGVDANNSLEGITVTGGRLNLFNALNNVRHYNINFPAPVNLEASYSHFSVELNWEHSDERAADYYLVFRNETTIDSLSADSVNYTDTSILSGRTYEYFLKAGYLNPSGKSEPSNQAIISILPSTPQLSFPENGAIGLSTEVTLEWSEETDQRGHYILQVAYDPGFMHLVEDVRDVSDNNYMTNELSNNTRYFWRVRAVNPAGESSWSHLFNFTVGELSVQQEDLPASFSGISRIFPNPFSANREERSGLNIELEMNEEKHSALKVYNIKGQVVKELFGGVLGQGKHSFSWNGENNYGQEMGSGIYLIILSTEDKYQAERILLLK